ncbi:hypothetical protein XANCAGTX0491_007099 [Xanthoria calcicola]
MVKADARDIGHRACAIVPFRTCRKTEPLHSLPAVGLWGLNLRPCYERARVSSDRWQRESKYNYIQTPCKHRSDDFSSLYGTTNETPARLAISGSVIRRKKAGMMGAT